MSFIDSWARLVDTVGFKGQNNTMGFLGGEGVLRGAASVGNPFTTFSSHNPLTSIAEGKGNLFGNYEEQTGAEESFNRLSATLGMGVGAYYGAGALLGGETATGGGGAAMEAGGGMGGLALGEGGSMAAGMGGMTLAEGGYAGAEGLGAEAGAIGMESSAVGGGQALEAESGTGMGSWTEPQAGNAVNWGSRFKYAGKALRTINAINQLRRR